jgi:hypothetical protein
MWIFCGGMPRSGSTLQFQLTAHLVEQAGLGARVEWVRPEEFPRLREKYARHGGWKVFKTHVCTADVQAEFAAHNAKGVYVSRDIRDVVVSRMRKGNESFDGSGGIGFLDRILTNFDRWTSLEAVLVSRYEDMVADVAGEVGRIGAHLGIAVDRKACETVASEYTVARQGERIREAEAGGRLRVAAGVFYDPVSNLHVDHIRSGRCGEWKGVLAREEVAVIEHHARGWLVANGCRLSLPAWQRFLLKRWYALRQRRTPGAS